MDIYLKATLLCSLFTMMFAWILSMLGELDATALTNGAWRWYHHVAFWLMFMSAFGGVYSFTIWLWLL